ncbi:hypothetical protein Peur_071236 [Populus x canadensis]
MTAFSKQFLSQKFVELSAESHMQMKPSTRTFRSGSNEKNSPAVLIMRHYPHTRSRWRSETSSIKSLVLFGWGTVAFGFHFLTPGRKTGSGSSLETSTSTTDPLPIPGFHFLHISRALRRVPSSLQGTSQNTRS